MNEPRFITLQRAFTQHLRDPDRVAAPPLPERGLAVYRNAIFLNIERFMRDNFPRVADAFPPDQWAALVRDYLIRHRADTPVFVELLGEFLHYLAHERQQAGDPPWLYEVAHFDWLENALASDERVSPAASDDGVDLLDTPLQVNPVHEVVSYRFPVHAIDANYRPDAPPAQPTLLVAFRDAEDDFAVLDMNPVAIALFEGVRDGEPARAVLARIADGLNHPDPAKVLAGGVALLERWLARGLLLGNAAGPDAVA